MSKLNEEQIVALERSLERAERAIHSDPAKSVAMSLTTLIGVNVQEMRNDFDKQHERDVAFADAIERVVLAHKLGAREQGRRVMAIVNELRAGYSKPTEQVDR